MRLLLTASILWIGLAHTLEGASPTPITRSMVVTIDDLPAQRLQGMPPHQGRGLTDSLLGALQLHQVPALGFVNEEKLYVDGALDPQRLALLERWLESGMELGNHSYSHPDLHRIPLDDFEADVLRGEEVSRPLAEARQMPFRYFRHPFLHTGLDLETKRALERFLDRHDYTVAPVTIDNSEWIFAVAFERSMERGDRELQRRVGNEYLSYMSEMVRYYEDQSRGLFDREIPQILLVHANDLNARYLEPLLADLEERGYRFVDLETALQDPAFDSPDTYVGPGGITWLHRWALTRGLGGSFFSGEPTTPQWIQELAGIEE